MKWINNDKLTKDKINEVMTYIDNDLLINRLCFTLKMTKDNLFKTVTQDEINLLVSSILINRGVLDKEQINSLFNDISLNVINPYKLHNAEKAANMITTYCKDKDAYIYVFADYDCDGVTSGYTMTSVLNGVSVCKVILKYPNRSEGYGLAMKWCNEIIKKHTNETTGKVEDRVIVITVDNGITKYKEVELLQANGIECIITDHHPSKEGEVPNCIVVNPHNATEIQTDEYKHLCGCGVAFKVCELVQHNFGINTMLDYTPYLAISTLSDVMPLTDENLTFIQYGLEIMNGNKCPKGIKALMKSKDIDTLTATDILWTVAPMINACGRMGDTAMAAKLFFLDNQLTPEEIVKEINTVNEKRKSITKKAQVAIEKMNFDNDKVCILTTDKYPGGILGIIAGKIAEKFNKPAIVVSKDNEGLYHGSIRSFNGIDMLKLLIKLKELKLIETYGGHSEACVCGFTLDKLDKIKEFFNNTVTEELHRNPSSAEPTLNIDEIITLDHLNDIVYTIVNMFPCDNRKYKNPTFALTDLKVLSYSQSKNNPNNICFNVKQGRQYKKIWAWGFANKYIELGFPENIHIAGTISKSFMDKKYTMNVMDIMSA